MIILCIDYGTQHCGIALADSPLAQPLETIPTRSLAHYLKSAIKKYHVDLILIGLSEGEMAKQIKIAANLLKSQLKVPIKFHDETLSSHETRVKMAKAGAKRKKRESKIDHLVAATILQDFLDSNT